MIACHSPSASVVAREDERLRAFARGRVVPVLDEHADRQSDDRLPRGVEQDERADRQSADGRGAAGQVPDEHVERDAHEPDEDQRPDVDDQIGACLIAEILVHAVGGDGGMEPEQSPPGERYCDQEGEPFSVIGGGSV